MLPATSHHVPSPRHTHPSLQMSKTLPPYSDCSGLPRCELDHTPTSRCPAFSSRHLIHGLSFYHLALATLSPRLHTSAVVSQESLPFPHPCPRPFLDWGLSMSNLRFPDPSALAIHISILQEPRQAPAHPSPIDGSRARLRLPLLGSNRVLSSHLLLLLTPPPKLGSPACPRPRTP